MKCPKCGHTESKVTDSRPSDDFLKIRRRRECIKCNSRFTTYEVVEVTPVVVVKKDNSRQVFDRRKLLNGMIRACEKRPVSIEILERGVSEIEEFYSNSFTHEVTSTELGNRALEYLKDIDDVAYIRFAAVYRAKEFDSIESFLKELNTISKK